MLTNPQQACKYSLEIYLLNLRPFNPVSLSLSLPRVYVFLLMSANNYVLLLSPLALQYWEITSRIFVFFGDKKLIKKIKQKLKHDSFFTSHIVLDTGVYVMIDANTGKVLHQIVLMKKVTTVTCACP